MCVSKLCFLWWEGSRFCNLWQFSHHTWRPVVNYFLSVFKINFCPRSLSFFVFILMIITTEIWIWISGRMLHPGGFSNQVIFFPKNLYLSYPCVWKNNLCSSKIVFMSTSFYTRIDPFILVLFFGMVVSYNLCVTSDIWSYRLRQR